MTEELKNRIVRWAQNSEGWTNAGRLIELAGMIIQNEPEIVVELGVFAGRSFIPQAMALKENGHGKVYGIDPWFVGAALEGEIPANREWWEKVDLEKMHQLCMKEIWIENLMDHAVIIRSESQNCPGLFSKGSIDLLTIDGNHSEVASVRDVNLWTPLVRPGGIIIFDDCDWASTQKAIAILAGCCDLMKDAVSYRIYRKK